MKTSAQIERQGNWLIVRFQEPHTTMSWAPVGGGKTQTDTIAWYQVSADDLRPPVDPLEFLKKRLDDIGISSAVGLLTSADLDSYADIEKTLEGITVRSIVTVGLANALRVGDLPRLAEPVGTINLLCQISRPLSKEAFLEALSIAAEARTVALLESGTLSTESKLPATGTGTDCIVIAAPTSGETLHFSGKHTSLGHLIGSTVLDALGLGIKSKRNSF